MCLIKVKMMLIIVSEMYESFLIEKPSRCIIRVHLFPPIPFPIINHGLILEVFFLPLNFIQAFEFVIEALR